jgi:hypothetical protein
MNIYLRALVISIIFIVFKYIEMRYIEKQIKPLKTLVKETVIVYFSSLIGIFVASNIQIMIENMDETAKNPTVFTSKPDF